MAFRNHQSGRCLTIGHRGAAGLAAENTLPGFELAARLGVDAVELDIHWAHGALWVIHDATLERTTDGAGALEDSDFNTLRRLDAGAGAPIPLLEEVLAVIPASIGINIELKGKGCAAPAAAMLATHLERDLLVSSFDYGELQRFHRLRPEIPVAPLFSRWRPDAWRRAAQVEAWSINLAARIATDARINVAHERGFKVLVYTVNDPADAARLTRSGVDGLFTDFPDKIELASATS